MSSPSSKGSDNDGCEYENGSSIKQRNEVFTKHVFRKLYPGCEKKLETESVGNSSSKSIPLPNDECDSGSVKHLESGSHSLTVSVSPQFHAQGVKIYGAARLHTASYESVDEKDEPSSDNISPDESYKPRKKRKKKSLSNSQQHSDIQDKKLSKGTDNNLTKNQKRKMKKKRSKEKRKNDQTSTKMNSFTFA